MAPKYASGKWAIAECDRCGQRYKLTQLKKLTIKTKLVAIKVCPECWEADHPQLKVGMYPVYDPQAVVEPRPDNSYDTSGLDSLGYVSGGSRDTQWGWNPAGGGNYLGLTPNALNNTPTISSVGITTS